MLAGRSSNVLIVALAVAASAGCSSSLTSMQPARLVPAGHVSATSSVQITPPTGLPGEVREQLEGMRGTSRRPTPEQAIEIATIAGAALAQPPSMDAQLALAVGLSKRFELDARVRSTSAGGGLRFQWLRIAPGIYGALGLQLDGSFGSFPLDRFTDRARIEQFRRFDLSVPLTVGYSRQWIHLWAGPKLAWSRVAADIAVCTDAPRDAPCRAEAPLTMSGSILYLAGQVGIAVGSSRFWVAFELTVAHARVRAALDLQMSGASMRDDITTSGAVVTPALGIILWI